MGSCDKVTNNGFMALAVEQPAGADVAAEQPVIEKDKKLTGKAVVALAKIRQSQLTAKLRSHDKVTGKGVIASAEHGKWLFAVEWGRCGKGADKGGIALNVADKGGIALSENCPLSRIRAASPWPKIASRCPLST